MYVLFVISSMEEKSIHIDQVPEKVYHIVPISLFEQYTNNEWLYDPRNRKDFGKNSPFIHTTPTIEQMNQSLSYLKELTDREFYLLEIKTRKLHNPKITYAQFQNRIYHHLRCALDIESYTKKIVKKDSKNEISL